MTRLVEAKVELAEACDRRNAADLEFRSAANRHDVGDMVVTARKVSHERRTINRLLDEIGELEAREAALRRDFGPEEEGEFR